MMRPTSSLLLCLWLAAPACTEDRSFTSDCTTNEDCSAEQYCAAGRCEAPAGVCTDRPVSCEPDIAEVCACDGETYRNLCEVRSLGLRVALVAGCPCEDDTTCGDNGFCGTDEACNLPGNCKIVPESCEDEIDAVCGCDDVTYRNECAAAAAEASVADDNGGCECSGDGDCESDQYCAIDGDCTAPGTCDFLPESCDDEIDVVCGCDGDTYRNECVARSATVSVEDRSAGCECENDGECADEQYCARDNGCDDTGTCNIAPESCDGERLAPICGCDGVTYRNQCEAQILEVSVANRGRGCPCQNETECDPSHYCDFTGNCNGSTGACNIPPDTCEGERIDPVCACDGTTYANDCEAQVAGAGIADDDAGCACSSNGQCGAGQYCELDNDCGDGEPPGMCGIRPTDCEGEPDRPVCGCDDVTYDNECEANLAGVSVASQGACS